MNAMTSRSPYGERGLKSRLLPDDAAELLSLSLRRAWIEIESTPPPHHKRTSLSLRRAWIEMSNHLAWC